MMTSVERPTATSAFLVPGGRASNATATAFNWTFTADDLDDLLARIDAHEHPDGDDTPTDPAGRMTTEELPVATT